jgi:hypothetical protein
MSVPQPTIPVVNAGLLYVNNLSVTAGALDAGTGLFCTTLLIGSGQARDSTDVNDITLSAGVTLNTAASGVVNGLDTGALAATTKYAVYAIGDSTGYQASGSLLSLSFTAPQLPFGYDMFRRIGTVLSNAGATGILSFNQRGNGSSRNTYYSVPLATLIAAGASATFAAVTLTTWVPTTASHVLILSALTADAGGTRTVVYSADANVTIAHAATAGEVISSSPASTVTSASLSVPITSAAGVQTIQYAVSNAAAAVAVLVQGFVDQL